MFEEIMKSIQFLSPQQSQGLANFGDTLKGIGNPAAFQEEQKTKLMQLQQEQSKKEMARQDALSKLTPEMLGQQGSIEGYLTQAAMIDPSLMPELIKYKMAKEAAMKPDWKVQEVDGALVRYNANDPTKAEPIYGLGGTGSGLPSKDLVKGEGELRKEFDNLNKDYRVVQDAYNKIQTTSQDPSAAGDLSLIFSYMKLLDPSSTVREGEFATAQNAAGVPVQIQNLWNRAKTGERLSPEQRADFLRQSENIFNSQAMTYDSGVEKYRGLATEYGYNPDRIVKPAKRGDANSAAKKDALIKKLEALKKQKGVQ